VKNSRPNRNSKMKGRIQTTTQTAPVQLSVVPDAQTQKEIENIIDAPRKVAEAIEAFKKNRADAKADLAQAIAKTSLPRPRTSSTARSRNTKPGRRKTTRWRLTSRRLKSCSRSLKGTLRN
jgi:hypothetical protein